MDKQILCLLTAWMVAPLCSGQAVKPLTLENHAVKAVFNRQNGALIELTDKQTGWHVVQRQALGQSFELLLPLEGAPFTPEDCRYNLIKGVEQQPPTVEQTARSVTFTWSGLRSETMTGSADVTFQGTVSLTDSGLEFSGNVSNRTPHTVEYVSWPCLGEVSVPDKSQPLLQSTRNDTKQLYPHFANRGAYWGTDYPTSIYILPEKTYLQIHNNQCGWMLYNRTLPRHTIITSFELVPGFDCRNTNPEAEVMDNQPVRVQLKANHTTYTQPGSSSQLDPLQLVPYQGNWEEGVKLYSRDRFAHTPAQPVPHWFTRPLTWRRVTVRKPSDLTRYAQESLSVGVEALLVRGWYRWSQGRPTEMEHLAEEIRQCQQQGLRVVLETNWLNTDRYAEGYAEHLSPYVMSDPFGMAYHHSYLCPCAPDVHQWAHEVWASLPALRQADGYMNNGHNHSGKTYMCFNTNHRHPYGAATINGMIDLDKEMADLLTRDTTKVALSQGFIEEQGDIYGGYLIGVNDNFYARHRLARPQMPILSRVDVKNARRNIHKALLYRMQMVYDMNFHNDRLADYTHILEYARQVNQLRQRYAQYLWNAQPSGTQGIRIEGAHLEYAVLTTTGGKRAVVVCNMSNDSATQATLTTGQSTRWSLATPESPQEQTFDGAITLPPLSTAILMEH